MNISNLTTIVRVLSKISDKKLYTKYYSHLIAVSKDANEYNGFNIHTTFDTPEEKRFFGKEILKPIEDRYKIQIHLYNHKKNV